MIRHSILLGVLVVLAAPGMPNARAQVPVATYPSAPHYAPAPYQVPAAAPYTITYPTQPAGHQHSRRIFPPWPFGPAGFGRSPNVDPYGRPRLPRGQVYYGGRYFGSFNDRFYGPQYGYF